MAAFSVDIRVAGLMSTEAGITVCTIVWRWCCVGSVVQWAFWDCVKILSAHIPSGLLRTWLNMQGCTSRMWFRSPPLNKLTWKVGMFRQNTNVHWQFYCDKLRHTTCHCVMITIYQHCRHIVWDISCRVLCVLGGGRGENPCAHDWHWNACSFATEAEAHIYFVCNIRQVMFVYIACLSHKNQISAVSTPPPPPFRLLLRFSLDRHAPRFSLLT